MWEGWKQMRIALGNLSENLISSSILWMYTDCMKEETKWRITDTVWSMLLATETNYNVTYTGWLWLNKTQTCKNNPAIKYVKMMPEKNKLVIKMQKAFLFYFTTFHHWKVFVSLDSSQFSPVYYIHSTTQQCPQQPRVNSRLCNYSRSLPATCKYHE